jgi:hypothetical protein
MVASLATIDDLFGSITGRHLHAEVRTASARADELLIGQPPPWLDAAAAKLGGFVRLPADWDSYGARPISFATVRDAWELLAGLCRLGVSAPTIVPTAQGGVQFEWDLPGVELELGLEPGGRMLAIFDDDRGESWERELPPRDLTSIQDALRRVVHAGHSR